MDGVGTPIIGRPRPLPGHDTPNPAYHPHTLNYEEPINRYPSGEIFVIFKQPMMVWTSPNKQTFNITLLGTPIEVEATPVSFNWDWGDGQSFETTDPGTPYPNYTVSHAYEVTGNGYVIKLRTSWSARWRIAGQTQWHQVNGTVTTTETSTPFNLYFADSYGTTP